MGIKHSEPCDWDIHYGGEPDPETQTILCRCYECGRYANLSCDRNFVTGQLVVQVRRCKAKGGHFETREQP